MYKRITARLRRSLEGRTALREGDHDFHWMNDSGTILLRRTGKSSTKTTRIREARTPFRWMSRPQTASTQALILALGKITTRIFLIGMTSGVSVQVTPPSRD